MLAYADSGHVCGQLTVLYQHIYVRNIMLFVLPGNLCIIYQSNVDLLRQQ